MSFPFSRALALFLCLPTGLAAAAPVRAADAATPAARAQDPEADSVDAAGPADPRLAPALAILAEGGAGQGRDADALRAPLARWETKWTAELAERVPTPAEWATRLLVRGLVNSRVEELQALLLRHPFESLPAAVRARLTRADALALATALRANASLRPVEIKARASDGASEARCDTLLLDGSAALPFTSVPGHTAELLCARAGKAVFVRKLEIPLGREVVIASIPEASNDSLEGKGDAASASVVAAGAHSQGSQPQAARASSDLRLGYALACATSASVWLGLRQSAALAPACLLELALAEDRVSARLGLGGLGLPAGLALHLRPGFDLSSGSLVSLGSLNLEASAGVAWSLLWDGGRLLPQRAPAPTVDLCGGIARTMGEAGAARIDACALFRANAPSLWGPALRLSWNPH